MIGLGPAPDRASRFRALTAFTLFLATACETAPQPAQSSSAVSIADSAGVRTIQLGAGALDNLPVWELGDPLLTLGELDGEAPFLFGNSIEARRLSDGSLVVLDRSARELRRFGADGAYLGSFGREGDGPGEFRAPQLMGVVTGDSIVIYDEVLLRVTTVTPDLGLAREEPAPRRPDCPGGSDGRQCEPESILASGHMVWEGEFGQFPSLAARQGEVIEGRPTLWGIWDAGEWVPVDSGGQPDAVVVRWENPSGRSVTDLVPQMWAGWTLGAVGRDLWAVGGTHDPSIRIRAGDVGLAAIVSFGWPAAPVVDDDVERHRNEWPANGGGSEFVDRWVGALEPAPTKPYIGNIELDAMDRLWIRDPHPLPLLAGEDTPAWHVIDLEHGPIATARVEGGEGFIVQERGDGWILATERGEFDIRQVVLYSVRVVGGG